MHKSVLGGDFTVWNDEYPSAEDIKDDIERGCLYALRENGMFVGAVSVVGENELDGFDCWKIREHTAEISRIAVRADCQGRGLSYELVSDVLKVLKEKGYAGVHLSCAEKNIPAQKNYKKLCFEFVGKTHMYGNDYYLCEKKL